VIGVDRGGTGRCSESGGESEIRIGIVIGKEGELSTEKGKGCLQW